MPRCLLYSDWSKVTRQHYWQLPMLVANHLYFYAANLSCQLITDSVTVQSCKAWNQTKTEVCCFEWDRRQNFIQLKMDTVVSAEGQINKKGRHRKKHLYNSILQQMEFYFSDSNLSKDRFLSQLIKDDPCKLLIVQLICRYI